MAYKTRTNCRSRSMPHAWFPCGRVRRFNPRRVKIHRSYTVEEVARIVSSAQEHGAHLAARRVSSRSTVADLS